MKFCRSSDQMLHNKPDRGQLGRLLSHQEALATMESAASAKMLL